MSALRILLLLLVGAGLVAQRRLVARAAALDEESTCLQKYRTCLKECVVKEPADVCTETCEKKYNCKLAECPEKFEQPCLFLANFPQDCQTDVDCPSPKRCCRSGYAGCNKHCVRTS